MPKPDEKESLHLARSCALATLNGVRDTILKRGVDILDEPVSIICDAEILGDYLLGGVILYMRKDFDTGNATILTITVGESDGDWQRIAALRKVTATSILDAWYQAPMYVRA